MKKSGLIFLLGLLGRDGFSQKNMNFSGTEKGRFFITWGWNRSAYTRSNIRFKGNDYDFELKKVVAHDEPSYFNINYLRIDRLTNPQTNFKIGYFVKENLSVSIGFDHMKYVMDNNQTVFMKGVITQRGKYEGVYNGDTKIAEDLLTYEHTDGLNYINVETEKYFNLYHGRSNKFVVNASIGAGAGLLMPRTDIKLLGYDRSDQFHVSGFGLNMKATIQATIFKHLLIKVENKNVFWLCCYIR